MLIANHPERNIIRAQLKQTESDKTSAPKRELGWSGGKAGS